jgi:precorrin-2 dehydrogenase/sirohydrochlorin ferrochelatase
MAKYPIFLELAGRRVVVIGGGAVAVRKVQPLLAAGARLVVVAEHIDNMLTALCKDTNAELIKSGYSKAFLAQASLAIAATSDKKLNRQIYRDCQELEVLCNVVDEPELCDFFVPAIVKRGDLQIAVGTNGRSPAYAGHIRKKLEEIFTDKHGQFLGELEALRDIVLEQIPDQAVRQVIFGELADDKSFDYFVKNGSAGWRKQATDIINSHTIQK